MTKHILPKLFIAFSFLISGCQSGKEPLNTTISESYKADDKKVVEQRKKELEKSVEDIPDWFLDQDEVGNMITSRGTSTSSDLQMSIDKAMLVAKRELASKLEENISVKTKQFLKDVGVDENSDSFDETLITSISRVDNVQLSGYKLSDKKVINLGTKYRTYIKLIYPIGSANKIIVEKIKNEEKLKYRLESSEAFKELEKEIENAKENKN
jgi:hypothetical protein